ncbi:MAG: dTDP-4-dehydrorhamnose reductase [Candidatus Woesebacteria bacterium GW2011_GWB1_39_10]|uniref:dTDP-4-dehydrorhamnose reductase n=1 Tax=Candidatus Woesebacteria bacterium GW2011_GWB1_39_10 TaxID=1618572 RepID=A0A0G0LJJ9_9BACT|nr:MAG: dTDP-4-dehydrorhamnose reductase [Candidatus Woesebacteria bacterium GW2011_GWB1_39_10]
MGSRFVELYPNPSDLLTPELNEFDLMHPDEYLAKNNPDVVLNFAAYTNVSEAQKQRDDKNGLCWQINVEGTKRLVSALPINTRLIHISTDMVFSGSASDPGPYSADHKPETNSQLLTWYGYTKAEAERIVGNRGTIVRLIYPVRAKYPAKLDYLRKPLDLFNQGKLYPLFTDQHTSLTLIDEACLSLQNIINENLSGVFHMSCPDTFTPYEIYIYLLQKLGKDISGVQKASVDPKRYPKFGGLKPSFNFSPWRQVIDQLIQQGIGT